MGIFTRHPVVRSKFSGPESALGMRNFIRNPVVVLRSKFSGPGSALGMRILYEVDGEKRKTKMQIFVVFFLAF